MDVWLAAPSARVLHPRTGHAAGLQTMLATLPVAGSLTNDAQLAALAVEHRATVVTFDGDFARFSDVRIERPT